MTREEYVAICKTCKNVKQSKKGLVCSLTNEYANFETECPNYVNQYQDKLNSKSTEELLSLLTTERENQDEATLKCALTILKYRGVSVDNLEVEIEKYISDTRKYMIEPNGWWKFIYYFSIPAGIILTWILGFVNYEESSWLDLCITFPLITIVGGYSVYAFVNRKPDTPFVTIAHFLFLFVTNLFVAIVSGIESAHTISTLIWQPIILITLFASPNYHELFPRKERKIFWWNWLLIGPYGLFMLVIILFSIVGSITPDTETLKTETFNIKYPSKYTITENVENEPIYGAWIWTNDNDGMFVLCEYEFAVNPKTCITGFGSNMASVFGAQINSDIDDIKVGNYSLAHATTTPVKGVSLQMYATTHNGRTFLFFASTSDVFQTFFNGMEFHNVPIKDWTMTQFFNTVYKDNCQYYYQSVDEGIEYISMCNIANKKTLDLTYRLYVDLEPFDYDYTSDDWFLEKKQELIASMKETAEAAPIIGIAKMKGYSLTFSYYDIDEELIYRIVLNNDEIQL